HRTFAEQFSFVTYQAQRCQRLQDAHANIAVELGGEAGARLAGKLNMPVSAGTLLDDIKQQPLLEVETPRVLGIDDWALKKREQKPLARGIIFEKLDMSLHNRYALLAQGCSMARYSLT
ncbi:MAG: hypothetical protein KC422_26335, partial [Trueperaceae bacterium]|nr:hypothetical protein [Trueperaceae bacterium]